MKKRKTLYAPEIDSIVENLHNAKDLINPRIYIKLKEIYSLISCLKTSKDDDLRTIWLEVKRGGISSFGSYREYKREGEVVTPEEFEALWKSYYPDETKWYKFQTAQYQDEQFFYFDNKLIFNINVWEEPQEKEHYQLEWDEQFTEWLSRNLSETLKRLKVDPEAFNMYVRQNLPWSKRYGRILRKDYHDIVGESTFRPDLGLGKEITGKLIRLVDEMKSQKLPLLPEMTANTFFRLCEIGYDANDYFKDVNNKLTPVEKYTRMADGRDDGLRKIDRDSPQAFREWYHHGQCGGHPWEICRGGNSTHISLYVSEKEGKWAIRLAGSSIGRVEETVRIAVALHENNIHFELTEADEIVHMVTATDYIGIVPEDVFPRYCHSLFPKEDRIISFMNLGHEKEFVPLIVEKSYWYPLEVIEVV